MSEYEIGYRRGQEIERERAKRDSRETLKISGTIGALFVTVLSLAYGSMNYLDRMKREATMKNPPIVYREDINRDGLEDIIVGGFEATKSKETEVWYNQGNNVYKRLELVREK